MLFLFYATDIIFSIKFSNWIITIIKIETFADLLSNINVYLVAGCVEDRIRLRMKIYFKKLHSYERMPLRCCSLIAFGEAEWRIGKCVKSQ